MTWGTTPRLTLLTKVVRFINQMERAPEVAPGEQKSVLPSPLKLPGSRNVHDAGVAGRATLRANRRPSIIHMPQAPEGMLQYNVWKYRYHQSLPAPDKMPPRGSRRAEIYDAVNRAVHEPDGARAGALRRQNEQLLPSR